MAPDPVRCLTRAVRTDGTIVKARSADPRAKRVGLTLVEQCATAERRQAGCTAVSRRRRRSPKEADCVGEADSSNPPDAPSRFRAASSRMDRRAGDRSAMTGGSRLSAGTSDALISTKGLDIPTTPR